MFVFGSAPLSGWISLSGTLASSSEISVQNPCTVFTFKHRNLGMMKTLTLSVSQPSKIFIDFVFVRNEYTGHTYKFTCQRWLGRSIDDGATERVLLGQLVHSQASISEIIKKSQQGRSSSIGRHWSRSGESAKDDMTAEQLQQLFGENVNQFVRFYYSQTQCAMNQEDDEEEEETLQITLEDNGPEPAKPKMSLGTSNMKQNSNRIASITMTQNIVSRTLCHPSKQLLGLRGQLSSAGAQYQELNALLFGDKQLIWTLQQIFYYGFKNRGRSSFRKQVFFWDYILRAQLELKLAYSARKVDDESGEGFLTPGLMASAGKRERRFVELVDAIANRAANWGKDGKMLLFLTVSLRDHLLGPHFVRILSKPSLAKQFFDGSSFLVNAQRLAFLVQILSTFDDMKILIDASLTKGL